MHRHRLVALARSSLATATVALATTPEPVADLPGVQAPDFVIIHAKGTSDGLLGDDFLEREIRPVGFIEQVIVAFLLGEISHLEIEFSHAVFAFRLHFTLLWVSRC